MKKNGGRKRLKKFEGAIKAYLERFSEAERKQIDLLKKAGNKKLLAFLNLWTFTNTFYMDFTFQGVSGRLVPLGLLSECVEGCFTDDKVRIDFWLDFLPDDSEILFATLNVVFLWRKSG